MNDTESNSEQQSTLFGEASKRLSGPWAPWVAIDRDHRRHGGREDHINERSDPICRAFVSSLKSDSWLWSLEGLKGLKVPSVPPSRQSGSGTPLSVLTRLAGYLRFLLESPFALAAAVSISHGDGESCHTRR